jgi:hypothetical protein
MLGSFPPGYLAYPSTVPLPWSTLDGVQRRGQHRDKPPACDDEPVLPQVARDERDVGWGDDPEGVRDEAWYRRERPPHHE